jgi:hypothetical protein
MIMRIILLFIIAGFFTSVARSQEADAVLTKFFAVQVNETVFLRWTMSAGSTCEDTYVERSSDGISYERIGLIGGICGSPDQEITFEFTDSVPLSNRTSYYRLLLGYFGYTSPKIIEFVRYNDKGYFVGPNPFNDHTRIAFDNEDNQEFRLMLSDMQGRNVLEMNTTGNEFLIRKDDLNAGIYAVRLYEGMIIFSNFKIIAY